MRLRPIALATVALCVMTAAPVGMSSSAAAADNPILAENQQPGTSSWFSQGPSGDDATGQIKGYWSATSVKQNENITLFVTVNPAQTFTIDIYRLGWYQGSGGRQRLHAGPLQGETQAACVPDPTTGLIACDWTPSYTLTVPGDWVSGVYLALLKNAAGFQNYTVFVVRDDRPAAFLYHQNIATDQAYNNYPNDGRTGKSLYTYNSFGANTVSGETRAVKVSFDRPYADHGVAQIDQIEFIRWIERSGYDVTYSTDLDTHANGQALRNHKAVLYVGHGEYWSKQIFDALEGARDAGVGLAFFAADTGSVQVRFEPSASGTANRVMVCYKDAALDPVFGPTTTVAFRQPPVNRAEQSLRGVLTSAMIQGQDNVGYVVTHSSHWIYAGTGFTDGDVVPGIVGYEMDSFLPEFPAPNSADWTLLSSSPFVDYLGRPGVANSSIYQAPSGAWVFSSGTISWSWALDGFWHQRADTRIQRTTANLLDAFMNGAPVAPSAEDLVVTAPLTATAGAPFSVTVAAMDADGAPVASYSGTVHFSSNDSASAVVLPADATLTNGQRTFSVTLATAGPQTVTVADAASSLSASVTVTVNAGAADHLALSTTATPAAGASFSFGVTALDPFGNTATAYAGSVRFASSDGAATLPPDSTLTNGQGTFAATLTKAGPQTITAT
ncbi:MAG TPA: N,N-dimethylformamidase beta subunit family domain-containing protein, partial [Candidatus Binatia bacterium]|nr:N,N-dimethylformamidase beta subunit family domain-containing protein [Candidatus Binatia bacterium]